MFDVAYSDSPLVTDEQYPEGIDAQKRRTVAYTVVGTYTVPDPGSPAWFDLSRFTGLSDLRVPPQRGAGRADRPAPGRPRADDLARSGSASTGRWTPRRSTWRSWTGPLPPRSGSRPRPPTPPTAARTRCCPTSISPCVRPGELGAHAAVPGDDRGPHAAAAAHPAAALRAGLHGGAGPAHARRAGRSCAGRAAPRCCASRWPSRSSWWLWPCRSGSRSRSAPPRSSPAAGCIPGSRCRWTVRPWRACWPSSRRAGGLGGARSG